MIRVALFGNAPGRTRSVAESLAEDDRIEIVNVQLHSGSGQFTAKDFVDVIVGVDVPLDHIPLSGPPVVALTNDPLSEMPLRQAIKAVLPLSSSPAEITAAIVAAANDLVVLTQSQARDWLSSVGMNYFDHGRELTTLTSREMQVLRMMADGLANKDIADHLRISEHTAKFHVAQILAKFGAGSRAEAVAIGIRRGFVPV